MRAVLTSFGTTGDIEPFLALAIELQRHGHEPVLASLPQYRDRALHCGIEFAPTGPENLFDAMRRSMKVEIEQGIARAAADLQQYPVRDLLRMYGDLARVCRNADVVIGSAKWPFGRMVHATTGIPFASVQLDRYKEQFSRESRQYIAAWEAQLAVFFQPFLARLNWSQQNHLLTNDSHSSELALYAVSRLLLDPSEEADWLPHHHVTGFFFVEETWTPAPELAWFLSSGPPPVVFTFGSMQYDDPGFADLLLETVRRLQCRAIFVQGWSDLFQGRQLPADAMVVDFVPYSWLFPRAACVVQAGGAGTTAWALRTGTPSVCLPHLWGQFTWQQFSYARFVESLNCGVLLPQADLNADALEAALRRVLADPAIEQAAQRVRLAIEAEGGVREARLRIEQWFAGLPVNANQQATTPAPEVFRGAGYRG